MLKEFKAFAVKGNALELAIGVVIGSAFGKIVSSLVGDIIMPLVGIFTGGVNFQYLKIVLKKAKGDMPAVTLNYGQFIQNIFDFLIISFSIFLFIQLLGKLKRKESKREEASISEEITKQEELLSEIRDILKSYKE